VTPAAVSLYALLAVIVVSCTSRINAGIVAVALAWLVGVYAGLRPDAVLAGFPASLFVTLAGVTLLFSAAEGNGTIAMFARWLLEMARGRARLVPLIIFLIAGFIATIGPGAIVSVAVTVPMAMAIALRAGISPFLTALMVANGANAGNLSPTSAVGIIANTRIAEAGLGAHEWKVWAANFLAHALVAGVAYVALVWRTADRSGVTAVEPDRFRAERRHWLTGTVIGLWVGAVVVAGVPIGPAAFAAAALLIVARVTNEADAVKRMPWAAILMVTGMALFVALVERTGGIELFTTLLARLANAATVNGVIALVTGLISTFSSTSAVVLPTFLPMATGLVQQVGGGDPLAVALSINVGASLVDVSPLSTLGALCVAAVADADSAADLFRKLLIWGLAMSVVGAVLCLLFANWFARL
jgi:di/tricarboxylate transporter